MEVAMNALTPRIIGTGVLINFIRHRLRQETLPWQVKFS